MADAHELVAEGILTIPDAEAFSGYKRSWLYDRMKGGELAYVQIGNSRRIPKRALVDLMAQYVVTRDEAAR